jgi:hypothetical protein
MFSRGGVMLWKFLIASILVSNIVSVSVPLAHFNFSSAAWRHLGIRVFVHMVGSLCRCLRCWNYLSSSWNCFASGCSVCTIRISK